MSLSGRQLYEETHNFTGKVESKTSRDMVEPMKTLECSRAQKNNQSVRIHILIQSTWSQLLSYSNVR